MGLAFPGFLGGLEVLEDLGFLENLVIPEHLEVPGFLGFLEDLVGPGCLKS